MRKEAEVRDAIRRFVIDTFLLGDASAMPGDSESFLATNTIDSTGVLEVVMFLESEFQISIEDHELVPENIDSVDNQTAYLLRKLHAA